MISAEQLHTLEPHTRQAVQAAKSAGLHPFCITIDEEAADYLPYLFGQQGFVALVHVTDFHRIADGDGAGIGFFLAHQHFEQGGFAHIGQAHNSGL